MSIITDMNNPMKILIRKKTIRHLKHEESLLVHSEINRYISQLKINIKEDRRWLSTKHSELDTDISAYETLTDYEWDVNELYFENELVKRRYQLYIKEILKATNEAFNMFFPRIPVCVIVTVQKGKYANISVRFHMYRNGEFHIEKNLKGYKQPVLYEIYNCDHIENESSDKNIDNAS